MKPDEEDMFQYGIFPCENCGRADMLWWAETKSKFFCSKCFNLLGGWD